jgi:DNA-binding IclR family transcriptional regulator
MRNSPMLSVQTSGEASERRGSTIQSVERAIRILKSFSLERPERGVNELARELGWHPSTVSRLMTTLERGALLSRNPDTDRYSLGIGLIGLAAQVVSYADVRREARKWLRELSMSCQETVNLVVLDAGQAFNLEQFVPQDRRVKSIGWVGRRMPLHCTAGGKVLLAYLPADEWAPYLPSTFERFTSRTIVNADDFLKELTQTRSQGYGVAQEELEEGLNAVAVPIFDYDGQVQSAATITGPAYRVTPDRFPVLVSKLTEAAAEISRRLGFPSGVPGLPLSR